VLNREVAIAKRKLGGITGQSHANDVLNEIQQDIRLGASNNPSVMSMTGKRYQYLRDRIQGAIDGATTNTDKNALTDVKKALDSAFDRSLGTQGAADLANLRRQKQTYEAIVGRTPTIDNVVTPEQALRAAAHSEGNKAVNTGRSPLANHARNAAAVMEPLPPRSEQTSDLWPVIGALLGGLTHGTAGYHLGGGMGALTGAGEGSVTGLLTLPHVVNTAKDIAARVATTRPTQAYLANQMWRPGAATTTDPATIARLLLLSPAKQGGQ
jgi:hypothetical protein